MRRDSFDFDDEDDPEDGPPFFTVVEPRNWTPNRVYRVYSDGSRLIGVYVGRSADVAVLVIVVGLAFYETAFPVEKLDRDGLSKFVLVFAEAFVILQKLFGHLELLCGMRGDADHLPYPAGARGGAEATERGAATPPLSRLARKIRSISRGGCRRMLWPP